MAASATFALKAGVCIRRARLLIVSPDSRANLARRQAETPLIALFRFAEPPLHRNILRYKQLFERLSVLADGPAFLLMDDLYHLRLSDQAQVLDYFFRIAKGANLWLKVGTIRHRSRWYVRGDPSV